MASKDEQFLQTLRDRYKLANEAEADQVARERDDIAFEDGEQWPDDIKRARMGQSAQAGMPPVPARPTLVIDKVKEPVRNVLNQERAADIGIEITPADDFGDLGITPDDAEITLREGLVRRIQRESHAADARTWAYKRAVIAGRGYYIVRARYLPGKTWDQEIYVDRILNQEAVKLDPSHQKPDGSDAEWAFIGAWMPWEKFKAEYPKDAKGKANPFKDADDKDFMSFVEEYPEWYQAENGEKAVRIVDHWYVERQARELCLLEDGTSAWKDELPEGVEPVDTRTVTDKTIQFCKVAGGTMILEETEEAGPHMPIVKVVGDEVLPYDEQRRYAGMIRAARGAQMGFNYMVSKWVEQVGLTPIAPVQVDPDAIDGYEDWWKVANTRTLPFLPARSYDDQGRQLNQPNRANFDPNLAPMAQSVGLFDAMIKSTTAVPDPTLGNVDPSLKSGRAIRETVQNASLSTSNYLDNLARSVQYEGEIINGKLYAIYGARPGRLVRVLTGEGDHDIIAVGDPQDQALQQKAQKVAKLTKDARFNVIVKVTKNYESRRTQEYSELGQLIAAEPQLMTWFGDLYLKSSDTPNRVQLADRAKVMLAPPIQQMLAAEQQGQQAPDPQVQQLQMLVTQLQAALQRAQAGGQEKMADIQSRERIAAQEMQLKQALAQLDAQVKLKIAQMQQQTTLQTKGAELQQRQTETMVDAQVRQQDAVLRDKGNLRDTLAAAEGQRAQHEHEQQQGMMDRDMQQRMAQEKATSQEDQQA